MFKYKDKEKESDLLQVLNNSNNITSLDLSYYNIEPEQVENLGKSLKSNTSLVKLDLTCCFIDIIGTTSLLKALELNNTLVNLILRWANIDLCIESLAKVLEINTSLTELDLSYNNISPNGAQILAKSIQNNTSLTRLDLTCNDNIPVDILKIIRRKIFINNRLYVMKKNACKIYLGFGKKTPYFILQKLLYDENLTEFENLKYSDKFLQMFKIENKFNYYI